MIEKEINGYVFNHSKSKFLEIYIFNNLSHTIKDLEQIASEHKLRLFKKTNEAVYLTRIYVYYTDYEEIKSLYSEINNRLKIKNISYYETIKTLRTALKYAFL